jgi:hypothetical protein
MSNLYFQDIFHLTDQQIANAKLGLNMTCDYGKKTCIEVWSGSPEDNRELGFAYASHQGKRRNFKPGELYFGFVKMERHKYLLVTASHIISVPDELDGVCEYEEIKEYQPFCNRLIVEIPKGNTYSRYIFTLSRFIKEMKVIEILSHDYEKLEFPGLDSICLSFKDLRNIIESQKYATYKNILMNIKGVYCLTDKHNGQLYIGSAYGEYGVAQRWEDYVNTQTGGNKSLIALYKEKGEGYFEENFQFTLIEHFGMYCDKDRILNREQYWKNAFHTRDCGYNNN